MLRGAQLPGLGQRPELISDRPEVLLRQYLGRGEQHGLPPAVDDLQHRPHRDNGLPGADLPLQQPVHRMIERDLVADLRAGQLLAHGQLERQPGVVGVEQPVGHARARRRRVRGGGEPPLRQHRLQQERLVPLQPVPRPPDVGPVDRPVDAAQRVGQAAQAVAFHDRLRHRVLDVQNVQGDPDRSGDLPGGDLLGGRVDRDHLCGVLGGGPGRVVTHVEQLIVGMSELALAPEGGDLAGEQSVQAGGELPLAPVLPPPGEEGKDQLPAPVGHGRLEDRAPPVAHRAAGHLGDHGLHGHVLAITQRGQVGQLAPGLVPSRVVPQQVADRMQIQRPAQRLGRLVTDHRAQRVLQDRHGPTPRRSGAGPGRRRSTRPRPTVWPGRELPC